MGTMTMSVRLMQSNGKNSAEADLNQKGEAYRLLLEQSAQDLVKRLRDLEGFSASASSAPLPGVDETSLLTWMSW